MPLALATQSTPSVLPVLHKPQSLLMFWALIALIMLLILLTLFSQHVLHALSALSALSALFSLFSVSGLSAVATLSPLFGLRALYALCTFRALHTPRATFTVGNTEPHAQPAPPNSSLLFSWAGLVIVLLPYAKNIKFTL